MDNQILTEKEDNFAEELVSEFIDETPTQETETNETDVVEETTTTEVKTEVNEPFLNIRYNKEDVALTKEEAIELAQKGKNYDNIYDKYNALNNQIDKLAKYNNMDVAKYISSLEDTQVKFEQNKEFKALKEKYPNSDDDILQELANKHVQERFESAISKANQEKQSLEDNHNAEIKRQVDLFKRHYPNLEADKLDPKVYDYMQDGYTLLEAYSLFRDGKSESMSKENESKAKVNAINESNKSKSLGTLSNVENIEGEDDFFKGFNSMF